jgi:hypothetical protein
MSITHSVYFNHVNSYLNLERNNQDGRLPFEASRRERDEKIEGWGQ